MNTPAKPLTATNHLDALAALVGCAVNRAYAGAELQVIAANINSHLAEVRAALTETEANRPALEALRKRIAELEASAATPKSPPPRKRK